MIACNCAGIPPTMPTCRDRHLPTCPAALLDQIAGMERTNAAARSRLTSDASEVDRAVLASEALTLRAVRGLATGVPRAEPGQEGGPSDG